MRTGNANLCRPSIADRADHSRSRRQNWNQIRQTVSVFYYRIAGNLDRCGTPQNVQQHLNSLPGRHHAQNQCPHAGKSAVGKNHFITGRKTIVHLQGFLAIKATLQLFDDRIWYRRNLTRKMHDCIDSVCAFDVAQPLTDHAPDKKITGKKRLVAPHQPAPGQTLNAQPRQKNFHVQPAAQIGGRNVLVLRFGPSANPSWVFCLHPVNNNSIHSVYF